MVKPRAGSQVVYRLTPASGDRCDVEPSVNLVTLRTDIDAVRLTLDEARSLQVYLGHAIVEAERLNGP